MSPRPFALLVLLPLLASCGVSPRVADVPGSGQVQAHARLSYQRVIWGVRQAALPRHDLDKHLNQSLIPLVQDGFHELGLTDFLLFRGGATTQHDVVALARYQDEAGYGSGNVTSSGRRLANRLLELFDPERSIAWPFASARSTSAGIQALDFQVGEQDWQTGYTVAFWLAPHSGASNPSNWSTLRSDLTVDLRALEHSGMQGCLASWHEREGVVFMAWSSFWSYTRTMAGSSGQALLAHLNRDFAVRSMVNAVPYLGRLQPGGMVQITPPRAAGGLGDMPAPLPPG